MAKRNQSVFNFFVDLEAYLVARLPPVSEVLPSLHSESVESRSLRNTSEQPARLFKEGLFVSRFITPSIHAFLVAHQAMSKEKATEVIFSENLLDRNRGFAKEEGITKYPDDLPFTKALGRSPAEVATDWCAGKTSTKHPDLCIREPFRTIVECKYLDPEKDRNLGVKSARTRIAECVYQSFFYLGLARRTDVAPAWDYEFACAMIYDGSKAHSVKLAWQDMPYNVKSSIWNAANIYVMVLD